MVICTITWTCDGYILFLWTHSIRILIITQHVVITVTITNLLQTFTSPIKNLTIKVINCRTTDHFINITVHSNNYTIKNTIEPINNSNIPTPTLHHINQDLSHHKNLSSIDIKKEWMHDMIESINTPYTNNMRWSQSRYS